MTSGFNAQRTVSGFKRRLRALTGAVFNFQLWYRDPAADGANYNLTDALEITLPVERVAPFLRSPSELVAVREVEGRAAG